MSDVHMNGYIPQFLFGPVRLLRIGCATNGKLSKDFTTGNKSLRPLVFSHGLGSHLNHYQALYKDYASHGYMVVAIDHKDGSCVYTEDGNGKKVDYWFKGDKNVA